MIDIISAAVAVLSLSYLIYLLVKKFPRVTNVNVESLPETKTKRQKEQIIKNRLERSWHDIWLKIEDLASPAKDKFNDFFRQRYQRLKSIEKDLRRKSHEQMTSTVAKSQAISDMIVEAKQFLNEEDYQKAEDLLLDAISIDSQNADAYRLLAEVYRERKEYVQAKETLEYLLKITNNEDAAVYSSLADIAKERGNLKQAEEDYLKSISLSNDNHFYFLALAEVYLELEEQDKALETAQKGLTLSPNNPKILDFLINLSIIMSDKELALQYLDKLKEVNPENNKIAEFTERIDELK
ncbi:hypothetical protein C4566_03710 [Candidatus Parcubacteria bacterium]|nr:MAG: hypothetical protein C4566_03710 [Candidatus Parcubacteria bacterium]